MDGHAWMLLHATMKEGIIGGFHTAVSYRVKIRKLLSYPYCKCPRRLNR